MDGRGGKIREPEHSLDKGEVEAERSGASPFSTRQNRRILPKACWRCEAVQSTSVHDSTPLYVLFMFVLCRKPPSSRFRQCPSPMRNWPRPCV